jgi:protein gp37
MAENSAIEWTDHTFNPWIGCTRVGPGCDHCYAADLSEARLGVRWGLGQPRRHTAASTWNQPRTWDRRAAKLRIRYRVFCASLADVFDNEVPAEWRAELFTLIRETPNLDWLLVTKRIGNADKMAQAAGGWPQNVWLGATIVNQAEAGRDIPKLLAVEGPRFRFLSMEPLLGPVDLEQAWHGESALSSECWGDCAWCEKGYTPLWNCQRDWSGARYEAGAKQRSGLDWIIVGGESGPNARPMHPDWARSLRDQCADADVPFLFKRWGEWAPLLSAATVDWPATNVAWPDGHVGAGSPRANGGKGEQLYRAAKKVAGRTLDGALHDGRPDRA